MEFTLDDLRTGHIVKFRNGNFYFIIKGNSVFDSNLIGLPLAGGPTWTCFGGTRKDFCSDIDNNFNIVEVYSIENHMAGSTTLEKFSTMKEILFCKTETELEELLKDKCAILYRPPAKELTVSEISKLLGYTVKVVEEHKSED